MSDDDQGAVILPPSSTLTDKIEYTHKALRFSTPLTYEEWEELGRMLRFMAGAVQWWIGDWLRYGEDVFGEKYAQAMDATGYEYQTLTNHAWVAGRLPDSRRRESLTWSHHEAVAALDVEQQESLLDWAEEPLREGEDAPRSVREVRQERDRRLGKQPIPPPEAEEPIFHYEGQGQDVLIELHKDFDRWRSRKVRVEVYRMR